MSKPTTRQVVLGGVAVVAAATLATSADSLYDLGSRCDMGQWFSAALPIALDDGGAIASVAWLTETGPARTWGRNPAVAALIGSLIGNGIDHAMIADLIPKTLALVLIVSAVIPAMLYASIHIAAVMLRPKSGTGDAAGGPLGDSGTEETQAVTLDDETVEDSEPPVTVIEHVSAVADQPPARLLSLAKRESDLDLAQRLLREKAGRPTLRRELRIGDNSAKTLQKTDPKEITGETLAEFQAREAAAQGRRQA